MSTPQPQPVESGEERFLAKQRAKLAVIDGSLVRARQRQRDYEAAGDDRSAEIQENVIDRLLRERREVKR